MRTTIRMRDDLLRRAKKLAAEEERTLTSIIEEGVTLVLARPRGAHPARVELPLSEASGGVLPGIDLNRASDLEAAMEGP